MKHLIRFAVGLMIIAVGIFSMVSIQALAHLHERHFMDEVALFLCVWLAYGLGNWILSGKTWRGIKF